MKKFTSIILICVLILAYAIPAMGADIKDAFGTISASELDSVANGTVNTSTGVLGYTGSTTRVCFKNVNFSKKAVSVELYSGTGPDSAGAIISVHLDSESGTKLASVPINACGWGNYEWNTAPISAESLLLFRLQTLKSLQARQLTSAGGTSAPSADFLKRRSFPIRLKR